MTTINNRITIDGPIEPVFDLVTNTRYWPDWHPATEFVCGVTERPLSVGDRVPERAVLGARVHEGTWTVTDHDRPRRAVLQIDRGRIQISYAFARYDAATLLTRELRYRPQDFAAGSTDPTDRARNAHAGPVRRGAAPAEATGGAAARVAGSAPAAQVKESRRVLAQVRTGLAR